MNKHEPESSIPELVEYTINKTNKLGNYYGLYSLKGKEGRFKSLIFDKMKQSNIVWSQPNKECNQ
jgi:hypothetical protein